MEWNTAADGAMIGEDAARVLDAARMASMLTPWQRGEVLGLSCGLDRVALLRVTSRGLLQCVAIAPSADWPDGATQHENLVFARAMPDTWQTKRRLGLFRPIPPDAQGFDCGWACGIIAGKRVIVCKVVAWCGDELQEVQASPDGETVPASSLGASRWWPFHKWPDGAARLFEVQEGHSIHNYRLACIQAANLDRKAKGLPATSGQAGKKLKAAKKAIDRAD